MSIQYIVLGFEPTTFRTESSTITRPRLPGLFTLKSAFKLLNDSSTNIVVPNAQVF